MASWTYDTFADVANRLQGRLAQARVVAPTDELEQLRDEAVPVPSGEFDGSDRSDDLTSDVPGSLVRGGKGGERVGLELVTSLRVDSLPPGCVLVLPLYFAGGEGILDGETGRVSNVGGSGFVGEGVREGYEVLGRIRFEDVGELSCCVVSFVSDWGESCREKGRSVEQRGSHSREERGEGEEERRGEFEERERLSQQFNLI